MRKLKQFIWFMRALMAARTVQDFLWGHVPGQRPNVDYAAWVAVMSKRIEKLNAIDFRNPVWKVEARKRLLQVAAVAVSMIEWIDTLPNGYYVAPKFDDNGEELAVRRMTKLLKDAQAAHHAEYGDAPHDEWPEYYARFMVTKLRSPNGTEAR